MAAEPSQSDRKSYIPRDLVLSLFQAEHEEHLDRDRPQQVTMASERQPMATRSVEPFSEGYGIDSGFVISFLKSLPKHLIQRMLFRLPPGQPRKHPLATDARIVVVGDWGTGEGLAIEVADRMREVIADAGAREVHVVHLGDVYYAGTRMEARPVSPVPPRLGGVPHEAPITDDRPPEPDATVSNPVPGPPRAAAARPRSGRSTPQRGQGRPGARTGSYPQPGGVGSRPPATRLQRRGGPVQAYPG